MPYYMLKGQRYFREAKMRKDSTTTAFKIILFVIISLDIIATLLLRNNVNLLETMQKLLTPVGLMFNVIGIPITADYIDGPFPPVFRRVLMLLSASYGIGQGILFAWPFCQRYRFFSCPAYYAILRQRISVRHPREDILARPWVYFLFIRIFWFVGFYVSFMTLWGVYPGRIVFHIKDTIVAIAFSLFPALIWGFLPMSFLGLMSCVCSDLNSVKKWLYPKKSMASAN
jgi:hypothetical protein